MSESWLVVLPDIHQRDDGAFEIGVDGFGPFPTLAFAAAVATKVAA